MRHRNGTVGSGSKVHTLGLDIVLIAREFPFPAREAAIINLLWSES
jgi:hypothetical protein